MSRNKGLIAMQLDPRVPSSQLSSAPNEAVGGLRRILFVGHQASRTGAPTVLLRLIRWFKTQTDAEVRLLLGSGGPLLDDYRREVPTRVWPGKDYRPESWVRQYPVLSRVSLKASRVSISQELRRFDPEVIFVNSLVSWAPFLLVKDIPSPMILRVPELSVGLEQIGERVVSPVFERADHMIAVSQAVKSQLIERRGISEDRISLIPGFLGEQIHPKGDRADRHRRLFKELHLPPDALIVGGGGRMDWQKGPDLFVQLALSVRRMMPGRPIHFVWIGGHLDQMKFLKHDVTQAGMGEWIHFLGLRDDPLEILDLMDVFAMTSREDPYPVIVLEAGSQGKPIVCFEGGGGAPEFVAGDSGIAVPYLDIEAMASRVAELLGSPDLCERLGSNARRKALEGHALDIIAPQILEQIERLRKRS